jgi:hypothetical protein
MAMDHVPVGAAAPSSRPPASLPPVWGSVARRLQAGLPVPWGLLLRLAPSSATVHELMLQARNGVPGEQLARSLGLSSEHGGLVLATLLQTGARSRAVRHACPPDAALIERLRAEIDAGSTVDEIVERHAFSAQQRLAYLIRSGLSTYAVERRQLARKDIQARIAQNQPIDEASLLLATGLKPERLLAILADLKGGHGLMQIIERYGLRWPDARLIAHAIRWKPSWRVREQRVGRLSLADVLARAARQEDPVWIAEAAGVRAQWVRQVLRREASVPPRQTAGKELRDGRSRSTARQPAPR